MSVLVLIILIMFLILVKCYKLHVRENEVNVHLIVVEHYKRYMDQKVEYNRRWDTHLSALADIFLNLLINVCIDLSLSLLYNNYTHKHTYIYLYIIYIALLHFCTSTFM